MAEAALARNVDRTLKTRGAWTINIHGEGHSRRGLPDRVAVYKGHALVLELKAPTGRVSRLQQRELALAIRAGAHVQVIRSGPELEQLLDDIDKKGHRCQ
jgi:hypothetical protein